MAKPVFTPQQIADQLTRSGLHWTGTSVTYSFPLSGATSTSYSVDATQKVWIREAIDLVEDVLGVSVIEVSPTASSDIKFVNDTGGGTYASTSYYPISGSIAGSTIYFDQTWSSNQSGNLDYGSYGFLTILHEFLHALGLSHPGDYNAGSGGSITYSNSAEFEQDTHRYTVMSYFSAYEDGSGTSHYYWNGSSWQWIYPQSPMVYDVLALTDGAFDGKFGGYAENPATRSGDTVYGYNATADRDIFDFSINEAPVLTIVDAGGTDTLDLSGDTATRALEATYNASGEFSGWQYVSSTYTRIIDLNEGSYSSTHGMSNNIGIAFGTAIENAIGTNFEDIIYGNDYANTLQGLAGDDILFGGAGNDFLDGGADLDVALFAGFMADYQVSLSGGFLTVSDLNAADGDEGTDWLTGIETLRFSDGDLAPDPTAEAEIAEVQTISLNHQWKTVTLLNTYENPVVVARVTTQNGGDPVTVRVGTLTANSVSLRLQEPSSNDGPHLMETISLFVVEAGSWIMGDGTLLEAGTLDSDRLSSQGFEAVSFNQPFNATPSVFSQVQSFHGSDYVATRQANASTDGFSVTMQEEEALNGGGHVSENIGWVAMERGSGSWDGIAYEVDASAQTVTDAFQMVSFATPFSSAPTVVTSLSSYSGSNPAVGRTHGVTATDFRVRVQEDQSSDGETGHIGEAFDYFAVSSGGTLSATKAQPMVAQVSETSLTHTSVTVELDDAVIDPVVIARVSSLNGSDEVVNRIGDIQSDRTVLAAGTLDTNKLTLSSSTPVSFDASTFSETPSIFSQVETFNGSDFDKTRQTGASATGFSVALEEEEANTGVGHASETIGWVAVERGVGSWNGNLFEVGTPGAVGTNNLTADTFDQTFSVDPLVLGSLATYNGTKPAELRYGDISSSSLDFRVEEDQSHDAETSHVAEAVDYFAIADAGLLTADYFDMV